MSEFFLIILSTFIVSLISFVGVFTLFLKGGILDRILLILVSFSAGALMGDSFFHLIPEAIEKTGIEGNSLLIVFLYVIAGFCVFFVLEQFIRWHHHHTMEHPEIVPFSYLILISDGLHNFIDGLIIAGSFIVSFPVGLATVFAVIFHEIPQELGNFGVLIYGGFGKKKALILNFLSAIIAILGGIVGFVLFKTIGGSILFLLPFAAGNFIYIACSDLIPEIKSRKTDMKTSLIHFLVFFLGIMLMLAFKLYFKAD
ncbi:MAG: ZIP family metal transporter [Candidatus Parcubacteria bacterium]|nr:ZIP family metal transporter [Candidatus Parcubacteria bacterium]